MCGSRGRQGRLPDFMCTDNLVTKKRPALKGGEGILTRDTAWLKDGFVEEACSQAALVNAGHMKWGCPLRLFFFLYDNKFVVN